MPCKAWFSRFLSPETSKGELWSLWSLTLPWPLQLKRCYVANDSVGPAFLSTSSKWTTAPRLRKCCGENVAPVSVFSVRSLLAATKKSSAWPIIQRSHGSSLDGNSVDNNVPIRCSKKCIDAEQNYSTPASWMNKSNEQHVQNVQAYMQTAGVAAKTAPTPDELWAAKTSTWAPHEDCTAGGSVSLSAGFAQTHWCCTSIYLWKRIQIVSNIFIFIYLFVNIFMLL